MLTVSGSAILKRPRRKSWRFQATFKTPLQSLAPFTAALLSPHKPLTGAVVELDTIVFEPRNLHTLLARYGLAPSVRPGQSLTASTGTAARELLEAVLGDWLDFYFSPSPGDFAIYADHDEYTTVLASTKGRISKTATSLELAGFTDVGDYKRTI